VFLVLIPIMKNSPRSTRPLARIALALLARAAAAVLAACGGDDTGGATGPSATGPPADAPTVVVTTPVLGALVADLVGDTARVEVVMPAGVDPHDFQPSARDATRMAEADLIVRNGLDLEEGLTEAIDRARDAGVPVFTATDHVRLRAFGEGEVAEEAHAGEEHAGEEHAHDEHGAEDPHIWLDPVRMSQVMGALAPVASRELGVDVAARATDLRARLAGLHRELAAEAATVPAARRRLVTGHESMGYFAQRYGFTLVGAVIPSLSSQAEPSAADLAALRDVIRREGVDVVFTEIGTPARVARAVAEETGARLVEVPSHTLPDDGSYFTLMRDVTGTVTAALGGDTGAGAASPATATTTAP
jgi:zinc/manganese transport system substrate-binding protein